MKLKVKMPIICEGKYDKIKLDSVLDADIITVNGFSLFNDLEKREMIKALAKKRGIIVLCDSDGAGMVLRQHIKSLCGKEGVYDLYIPQIEGKEKRKEKPSKEGLLGVEGIDVDIIRKIFSEFEDKENKEIKKITKADFYADGYSGREGSLEKRKKLQKHLSLPDNMSADSLLTALNLLYGYEEYKKITEELK